MVCVGRGLRLLGCIQHTAVAAFMIFQVKVRLFRLNQSFHDHVYRPSTGRYSCTYTNRTVAYRLPYRVVWGGYQRTAGGKNERFDFKLSLKLGFVGSKKFIILSAAGRWWRPHPTRTPLRDRGSNPTATPTGRALHTPG